MRCVAGTVYRPMIGLDEGWILHDGARVVDAGQGRPPQRPEAEGLILPAPVDAHTHVGDMVGRGRELRGMTLAEVVRPPHGLKHRLLRETPRAALVDGMRRAIGELRTAGARACIDFREQGVDGVRMLREAARDFRALAYARCGSAWDDAEAELVAREADGIGLSAIGDVHDDVPERAAAAARRHGKPFALHFSEDARDDAPRALDLRPRFLVHACRATRDDLHSIAGEKVPLVLCPRSNALFGRAPPVRDILELGIPFALGSDNAMFHPLDVLADARELAAAHPDVPRETWLDAAIVTGGELAEGGRRSWLQKGDPAELLVVPGLDALFGGP